MLDNPLPFSIYFNYITLVILSLNVLEMIFKSRLSSFLVYILLLPALSTCSIHFKFVRIMHITEYMVRLERRHIKSLYICFISKY